MELNFYLFSDLADVGEKIFFESDELYSVNELIDGVKIHDKTHYVLARNTLRGFHRKNKKSEEGRPSRIFKKFFYSIKSNIIEGLSKINSKDKLDELEENLCSKLDKDLQIHIENLGSYNKIRKPIDIFIENIVTMAVELRDLRKKLIPLLFVPLDSFILGNDDIIPPEIKKELNIKKGSTFGSIEKRESYLKIQNYLSNVASNISKEIRKNFYPIYFDLLWKDRYKNYEYGKTKNLYHLNL